MRYDVVRYVVGQTLRIISVPFFAVVLGLLMMDFYDPDFDSFPIVAFAAPASIALATGTLLCLSLIHI